VLAGRTPLGGRDYPRDEGELEATFATEQACYEFVERVRYPGGYVCPSCGSNRDPWRSGSGLIACRACRNPQRLTDESLFAGSSVPLSRWFRLLWEVADSESGTSASAIRRWLGLEDGAIAAAHLHALRTAMADASSDKLSRTVSLAVNRLEVESDQGPLRAVVLLAMKVSARHKVRVRLRHLKTASAEEVLRFAEDVIEPGSKVQTVPWRGFEGLSAAGFQHRVQPMGPTTTRRKSIPDPQQLWSVLRLWLWSTPGVDAETLQSCLDEFAFGRSRSDYPPGLLFYRLCALVLAPPREDEHRKRATEQGQRASSDR
jgi:hypothetical protein